MMIDGDDKVEFEMIDLGILTYFLGMKFVYINSGVLLHKRKYTFDVLKKIQYGRLQ